MGAAIPATVVAAASFDDAIAITGYTLCINLAVRGSGNAAWSAAHGPLSIVLGIASGTLAAFVASATRLWSTGARRVLVMVFLGAQHAPVSSTVGLPALPAGACDVRNTKSGKLANALIACRTAMHVVSIMYICAHTYINKVKVVQ